MFNLAGGLFREAGRAFALCILFTSETVIKEDGAIVVRDLGKINGGRSRSGLKCDELIPSLSDPDINFNGNSILWWKKFFLGDTNKFTSQFNAFLVFRISKDLQQTIFNFF